VRDCRCGLEAAKRDQFGGGAQIGDLVLTANL
jgi:hypothetical protein